MEDPAGAEDTPVKEEVPGLCGPAVEKLVSELRDNQWRPSTSPPRGRRAGGRGRRILAVIQKAPEYRTLG